MAGKTADVTVGLNPRTGVTIAAPDDADCRRPAGDVHGRRRQPPQIFATLAVDFGDGGQQSLGAISGNTTIQHTYLEANTYIVRATATDASGFSRTSLDVA